MRNEKTEIYDLSTSNAGALYTYMGCSKKTALVSAYILEEHGARSLYDQEIISKSRSLIIETENTLAIGNLCCLL